MQCLSTMYRSVKECGMSIKKVRFKKVSDYWFSDNTDSEYTIERGLFLYPLKRNNHLIGCFKTIGAAKEVAELLENG